MTENISPVESADLKRAGLSETDTVRADLQAARDEVARTVNALVEKLDVKSRAGEQLNKAKTKAGDQFNKAKTQAGDQFNKAKAKASEVAERSKPHRTKIIGGAVAVTAVVAAVLVRRNLKARANSGDGDQLP